MEKVNGEVQESFGGIMTECNADRPADRVLSQEEAVSFTCSNLKISPSNSLTNEKICRLSFIYNNDSEFLLGLGLVLFDIEQYHI